VTSKVHRIALFGAGRIGQVHAANIAAHSRTEIALVVDPFGDAGAALAARLGVPLVDADAAFADDTIDAIVICSATETHADLIERGLTSGRAVFCEKPIDLSLARVEALLDSVADCDAPLLVAFNRRFDPAVAALEAGIRAGDIGDVELVTVMSKDPAPPTLAYLEGSGGLFRDMTIHDLDIARFLLGEEPTSVVATAAAITSPDIRAAGDFDTACITLQCASGRMAVITNSRRAAFGYDQRMEAHGSLGTLRTENVPASTLVLERADGVRRENPMHFFIERYADAYRLEWAHFVEVLDGTVPPRATGEDGRLSLVLAEAAYASLEGGRRVAVP